METSILAYSPETLPTLVEQIGQPKYRTKQLLQWLYQRGAESYDDMTNLPKAMRSTLKDVAPLVVPQVVDKQLSKDGTRKYLLQMADGALVETVGIPSRDTNAKGKARRLTVCFSTQVGCPMACAFCATGKEGLKRNLLPGEIAWQLLICEKDLGMRVSNAVAMGQGEPFLNYDNVIGALHILNNPNCLNIGARHISVSTCGILDGIERFGKEPEQFTLAVSLHCAIQKSRDALMPRCTSMPLQQLHTSLQRYQESSGRRVSFEYLMIIGITDTEECLEALISFCNGISAHVNMLRINEIDDSPFKPSSEKRINRFLSALAQKHIEATVRDSRGSDIDGACGQLINKRGKQQASRH